MWIYNFPPYAFLISLKLTIPDFYLSILIQFNTKIHNRCIEYPFVRVCTVGVTLTGLN